MKYWLLCAQSTFSNSLFLMVLMCALESVAHRAI